MSDKQTPGPATMKLKKLVTSEYLVVGKEARIVFCGACNIVDANGVPERNRGRDSLLLWAEKTDIPFYEVQVHPTTHNREYSYDIDGKKEQLAREHAELRVYEIRSDVTGIVTFGELLQDAALGRKSIVWLRSGWQMFKHPFAGTVSDIKTNTWLSGQMGALYHGLFLQLLKQAEIQRQTVVDFIQQSQMSQTSSLVFVEGDNVDHVINAIKTALNLS